MAQEFQGLFKNTVSTLYDVQFIIMHSYGHYRWASARYCPEFNPERLNHKISCLD
jgi:hypothetical protein